MRDLESVCRALDTRRELDYKYSSLGTILTYMDLMQNQVFGENLTIYSKSENNCLLNLAWFPEKGFLRVRYSGSTLNIAKSFSKTNIPRKYYENLLSGDKALYRLHEQFKKIEESFPDAEETELEIILNITSENMKTIVPKLIVMIDKKPME